MRGSHAMSAKVISSEARSISLSVTGADIGILYIIQHEILKKPSTNFAGVIVKHPLTNECWVRVNSSARPINEIKKATDAAMQTVKDLKKLLDSVVRID